MFFAWGSGTKQIECVSDAGVRACPICNSDQPFRALLTYRYAHLWYLFRWVRQREYALACKRCGNGPAVEPKELEGKLAGDPVPFLDRRGWMFGAGLLALAGAGITAIIVQDNSKLAELSASPRAGDIYSADLSRISQGFKDGPSYGLMRLKSADASALEFEIAGTAYSRPRGARDALSGGAFRRDGYFSDETRRLSPAEVKRLIDGRTITDIRRP